MVKETYESPEMTFEEVMVDEAVANTCWGHHSSGKVQYADIPGTGFMSFQIKNGSCTLDLINVQYYKDYADYSDDKKGSTATAEQIAALDKVLRASGGESGNPYKGEGETTRDEPLQKWS